MKQEKRLHSRWEMDEPVYCYVDGDRMDAQTLDLSSGGMFLRTDQMAPVGSKLVLVFKTQCATSEFPIYLVARVVRRQTKPVGLGLVWIRATTKGPELQLAVFLRKMLRTQYPTVEKAPVGRKGTIQSVYEFSAKARSSVQVQAGCTEAPGPGPAPLSQDTDGPLTRKTRRDNALAPASVRAGLVIRGERHDVYLSHLGMKEAWMTGADLPGSMGDAVQLIITVVLPGGASRVFCSCTVLETGRKGSGQKTVKLRIGDVDEGRNEGVFYHYVRWLHFNAVRDARTD